MKRVGFITPNDEFYQMSYSDVENFCKKVCMSEENKDAFIEFSKDYTYFSPYFDFVMKEKKYLFFNPLYRGKKYWVYDNGAYYENDIVSFDYMENIQSFLEKKKIMNFISSATLSSDKELSLKVQVPEALDECLLDVNNMGMMSKTGVNNLDGSHIVTGSTVLNLLLCNSMNLANDYYTYLQDFGYKAAADSVNYLTKRVSFLRIAGTKNSGYVIGNEKILTDKQQLFLMECEKNNYEFVNYKREEKLMVNEYLNVLDGKNK